MTKTEEILSEKLAELNMTPILDWDDRVEINEKFKSLENVTLPKENFIGLVEDIESSLTSVIEDLKFLLGLLK